MTDTMIEPPQVETPRQALATSIQRVIELRDEVRTAEAKLGERRQDLALAEKVAESMWFESGVGEGLFRVYQCTRAADLWAVTLSGDTNLTIKAEPMQNL